MTKESLLEKLRIFLDDENHIEMILYCVLKTGELKKLDLKNEDHNSIITLYSNELNRVFIDNHDYSIINLSDADERANCYYNYDLDIPEDFECLESVYTDDIELFNFNISTLSDISNIIVALKCGDVKIALYKKLYSLEIIGRSTCLLGLYKDENRFKKVEEELLRLSPKFQIAAIDGEMLVVDLNFLERNNGFTDVIKKEALKGIKIIESSNLVENIDVLTESADNVTFARKLTKVSKTSPILTKNIPNNRVIDFIKSHSLLKGKIKHNNTDKVRLDTKVSQNLFVKLLNDDYLKSLLTEEEYDSLAKDTLK